MTAVGNRTYTRRANLVVSLVRSDGVPWSGTTSDPHPPFGNEEGSTRLARIEIRFPEPDWPHTPSTGDTAGRLVNARLKMRGRRDAHSGYLGANPRVSVKRITETPNRESPSSTGGDPKEWSVSGWEVHDVTAMVEESLPSRIRRQSDPDLGCGNRPYGMFQIQSSDEADDQRSGVLADDFYLSVELKTSVTPGMPIIDSIAGAQVDDSGDVITGPVIVATTTGTVLDVTFTYVGASGDTAAKAEMELRALGATDGPPPTGTIIKSTGVVVPTKVGTDQYRIRMTDVPAGAIGKLHIRATSQKGVTGEWSSFDAELAHVQVVAMPGPPLDIVFQPYIDDPHILFSLNSADASDYITGGEVEATLLPQGTVAFDTGMQDVTIANLRRMDIASGQTFAPGQSISYRVRTRNSHQVIGQWSAPATVVVRETATPTLSPAPGRLTDRTPTFTITDALFDGYRLRLLDPVDDDTVLYDTGSTSVSNQTSVSVTIPAGKVTWGSRFRVVTSTLPDGLTAYGTESTPQPYSIASLPVSRLSVPDAVNGKVDTTTPTWLRTVTDPDGGVISYIVQEVRAAATPQGSGSRVTIFLSGADLPETAIPAGAIPYETSVDSRVLGINDIDHPWSTTLATGVSAGATSLTLVSAASATVGDQIVILSSSLGHDELRTIATKAGSVVTFTDPLEHAHTTGQSVFGVVVGTWSPWLTITALQPPDVDLITPTDADTIHDPTGSVVWSFAGYAGRTQAGAVVGVYTSGGVLVGSIEVDGSGNTAGIPAYLLDDATDYLWDVTVVDSQGMETTSAQRTFTTAFAEPLPVDVVFAIADPASGAVDVTWGTIAEPYPHNIEVTWLAADGSPVRIDGGPEEFGDGNEPFTGGSVHHIGARLGLNVYHVAISNGWRSSEPVTASDTLRVPDPAFPWLIVDGTGVVAPLPVTGASKGDGAIIERMQAPGASPRQVTWGGEARTWSISVQSLDEDPDLKAGLGSLMRAGAGVWIKAPEGFHEEPLWSAIQRLSPTPGIYGIVDTSVELAELGDPVYAILPPVADVTAEEGNIYSTVDALDFGTFEET